jgi:hypothetical protein
MNKETKGHGSGASNRFSPDGREAAMCNAVSVFPRNQYWVVRIVEQGAEAEREFLYEVHARAWAEGQYIRLNRSFSPSAGIVKRAPMEAGGCFESLENGHTSFGGMIPG